MSYRTPAEPCINCGCICHESFSHRASRFVRSFPWTTIKKYVPIVAGIIGVIALLIGFYFLMAWGERKNSLEYIESTTSCRESAVMIGPASGQPNSHECRKDQTVTTRDVGASTLITCECKR